MSISIRPALGWLALLLFTTTAQAGGVRDLLKGASDLRKSRTPATSGPAEGGPTERQRGTSASVTPKTKAPPRMLTAAAVAPAQQPSLVVVESTGKPRADYEADVHASAALDGPTAKERGVDRGLVVMVFEHQRRAAFRVSRDRIRRVLRLALDERAVARTTPAAPHSRDHVDVLDTDDGVIVVDTRVEDAGLFTTSDVYLFPRGAGLEQRVGVLEASGVAPRSRDRVREALVAAEWAR